MKKINTYFKFIISLHKKKIEGIDLMTLTMCHFNENSGIFRPDWELLS